MLTRGFILHCVIYLLVSVFFFFSFFFQYDWKDQVIFLNSTLQSCIVPINKKHDVSFHVCSVV